MSKSTIAEAVKTPTDNGGYVYHIADKAIIIASPHPIAGFSQSGWEVELLGFKTATTVHIGYDELDDLAAAWSGVMVAAAAGVAA